MVMYVNAFLIFLLSFLQQEEYEVANLLFSLNHDGNYTRENVTLATPFSKTDQKTPADAFELLANSSLSSNQLHDTVLDPSLAPYQTMQTKITETPVFDETFVILNHLQSITEQTLALQVVLLSSFSFSSSERLILIDEIKTRISSETRTIISI